jgi:hypothetical protein
MSRKQLKTNTHAISTLAIALIIIIIVGSVVAVVVAAVLLGFWKPSGQVVGSGNLATEEKSFTDFAIVKVGWGFEVEINQSDSYSIDITADDNMFDYIEVSQTGETLTIGLKWGYSYQDVTLRAEITMPNLSDLWLSGGTHGTLGNPSSHCLVVFLSGGSSLTGDFTTDECAHFYLSEGSHLTGLDGAVNREFTINATGGSHLDLSDFHAHNVIVNLSGGSHATINLDGRLDGDVSGGSHLKYIGNPTTVDVNTSGGSTVEKIG